MPKWSDENRSNLEIERWTKILEKNAFIREETASQRLCNYVCSLVLGREFGETPESYFERKGLTDFVNWAKGK